MRDIRSAIDDSVAEDRIVTIEADSFDEVHRALVDVTIDYDYAYVDNATVDVWNEGGDLGDWRLKVVIVRREEKV